MAKVQYLWVDQELCGFNLGLVVPLDAGGRFLCTSRDGNGINSRHGMHHANSHGPMNHTFSVPIVDPAKREQCRSLDILQDTSPRQPRRQTIGLSL